MDGLFDLSDIENMPDSVSESTDLEDLDNVFEESDVTGVKETPSGKPYDAKGVPIPKNGNISADAYNSAISALKKSFKEGYEVLEMLENTNIVDVTVESKQDDYTENAIYEAMVNSYYDGPIFEAIEKENKDEIKKITKEIRKKLCKFSRKIKWVFRKTSAGHGLTVLDNFSLKSLGKELKMYSWQTVAFINPSRKTSMNEVVKSLNEEFKETLGDYQLKILKAKLTYGVISSIKNLDKDESENKAKALQNYILIVDEKDSTAPNDITLKISKDDFNTLVKFKEDADDKK